jgi:hypothetical protein
MSNIPKPVKNATLSGLEFEALQKSGDLAQLVREIIGEGPNAYNDWLEATVHIHAIQNMILSQAAARAYPDTLRLLGQKLEPKPDKKT